MLRSLWDTVYAYGMESRINYPNCKNNKVWKALSGLIRDMITHREIVNITVYLGLSNMLIDSTGDEHPYLQQLITIIKSMPRDYVFPNEAQWVLPTIDLPQYIFIKEMEKVAMSEFKTTTAELNNLQKQIYTLRYSAINLMRVLRLAFCYGQFKGIFKARFQSMSVELRGQIGLYKRYFSDEEIKTGIDDNIILPVNICACSIAW
jgi:hypothetical protein